MKRDFEAALRRQYGDDSSPIMNQHLEFALSTRRRARALLDQLEQRTGRSVDGARVLDVGCAYAGFVIEAAARGADAWGVEISRKLWQLGRLNARGEPGDIDLVPGDFLSPRVARQLPGEFSLVIVNDVFEHIYDTAGLLAQLHGVMADDAAFVWAIPNGESVRYVAREGHYGVPGVSLLAANWWNAIVPSFTAFYRPWSFYSGLFRAFGFHRIEPWNATPIVPIDEARERILSGLERAEAELASLEYRDTKAEPVMRAAFADYRRRVHADLARGDERVLTWRYLTDMWKGCAIKTGPLLADLVAPGVELPAADPTPPASDYRAVDLARPVAELESGWTQRTTATITATRGEIRCEVVGADTSASGGQYGGVRLSIASPQTLRLELELIEPADIEAVYVDGEDDRRCRVMRWQWPCRRDPDAAGRRRIELTPGQSAEPFASHEPTYPLLVTDVHVFIRIAPGRRAGFIIHRVETR